LFVIALSFFLIAGVIISPPVYETPEIIKADSPAAEHFNRRVLNLNKSAKERAALDKQNTQKASARNDLVRGFSLDGVNKWVRTLAKDNITQMNSNDIVDNLNNIRTISVKVQTFIHGVCSKITDSMKLYDLKLKEIQVLDKKIKEEKENLQDKPKGKPNKARRLKQKLMQEKAHVASTVKNVVGHHNKLIKVVSVYNKKFAAKNKNNLKDLLTNITLQLKGQMKNPHFKEAYKQFMVIVVKKVQALSADALKNPVPTARKLIHDHFNKIIADLAKKDAKKKLHQKYPPLVKAKKQK
jgi:hypothetical protein